MTQASATLKGLFADSRVREEFLEYVKQVRADATKEITVAQDVDRIRQLQGFCAGLAQITTDLTGVKL
jgi:hypothetical protein